MRRQGQKFKRVLGFMLIMTLFLSSSWCGGLEVKAATVTPAAKSIPTLSGNQRQDAISIAKSQVGYAEGNGNLNIYGKELGHNGEEWCAYFVVWCLKKAAVTERPTSGSTTANITWFQNRGCWHNKLAASWKYNGNSCNGVIDTGYEPQPGDFVAIENNGSYSDGPDHTAFVVGVDNSWVYTVEGNIANAVVERKYSKANWKLNGSTSSSVMVSGFGEIKYSGSGNLDSDGTPVAKQLPILTGRKRSDIGNIATSQIGYTEGGGNLNIYGKELGQNGVAWGAYFAVWCYKQSGLEEYPVSGSTTANISWFQKKELWHNKQAIIWNYNGNGCNGVVDYYYSPQVGDYIAIESNGNASDGPDNTGIVVGVDESWVFTVEGNINGSVVERKYAKTNWKLDGYENSTIYISGVGEIECKGDNIPQGSFDSVISEKGAITVSGWAFDRDDLNTNLAIHVYVGGPAGSGAPCYPIMANKYRKDVNDAYPGVGNYHGFAETIKVSARGEKDIYVYAINNEKDQHNPLLGKKTVEITNEFSVDFEEKLLNVNSGENKGMNIKFTGDGISYIKCQVEDTEVCSGKWENTDWTLGTTTLVISGKKAGMTKVTMLLLDSQKELLYQKSFDVTVNVDRGTVIISSDKLILNTTNSKSGEITLDFSECKNVSKVYGDYTNKNIILESCEYDDSTATFVYTAVRAGETRVVYNIIDTYGNVVGTINAEIVVQQPVTSIVLDKSTLTLNKSENYTLTGTVTPSNANNKTINWSSSNASVATVDANGLVKAVGKGEATITAIATDGSGVMAQCKVKVTEQIHEPIYRFADVSEGTWQYNVAKHAVEAELMKGKSNTADGLIIFDPNNNMTRAEFVQTLYNKEGKPAVNYTATFKDVPAGQWYTNAILWAAQNNIVAGKGENFDVSGNITRQEMATILYKYATNFKRFETAGRTGFDGYVDAGSISNWATENMKWAIHYGIMKGQGNKLAPQANATRAECAAMLKNFMDIYE